LSELGLNMIASNRTTLDIIRSAEDTLKTAIQGLEDLVKGPQERKLSGLRNLVVFGRAVTNIIQNLRSTEQDFETWYKKYQEEMKSDPLLKYFYELRSKILKEGVLKTLTKVFIRKLEVPKDLAGFGTPPQNAKGFFIGDTLGGSGWEVELPDGSLEKYYVELPSDIGSISVHFPDAPNYHLGKEIEDTSITKLAKLYINYLRNLIIAAKDRFIKR
jgi:hypothetical protein